MNGDLTALVLRVGSLKFPHLRWQVVPMRGDGLHSVASHGQVQASRGLNELVVYKDAHGGRFVYLASVMQDLADEMEATLLAGVGGA